MNTIFFNRIEDPKVLLNITDNYNQIHDLEY